MSVIKSRRMRWAGHVVRVRMITNAYRVLVEELEGKRPLGKIYTHRLEHNYIVGCKGRNWTHVTQDTVNTVMNLLVT
jgi:hypothetical protein